MANAYRSRKSTTYGRASRVARRLRTSTTARKQTVSKKRATNRPVAKIQRNSYVPQRAKNTASIVTLAKQVRSLQNSQVGSIQRRFERTSLNFTGGSFEWAGFAPIAFCCNDFMLDVAPNCPVYGVQISATPEDTSVVHRAHFTEANMNKTNDTRYDMWQDSQNDATSKIQYMPIKSKISIEFQCSPNPADPVLWYRVDFVKPTSLIFQNSTKHQFSMPSSLPGFANLAVDNQTDRGAINKRLFTSVARTKWVKITPPDLVSDPQRARVHQTINFPAKILKPDCEDHLTSGEHFYMNVPMKDHVWCVISCSGGPGPLRDTTINIQRQNVWRDPHGTSTP